LANETKLWHEFVRIAAIDCAFEELNGDLCWKNDFPSFPSFKFFPGELDFSHSSYLSLLSLFG
jgi:hypothetical protein